MDPEEGSRADPPPEGDSLQGLQVGILPFPTEVDSGQLASIETDLPEELMQPILRGVDPNLEHLFMPLIRPVLTILGMDRVTIPPPIRSTVLTNTAAKGNLGVDPETEDDHSLQMPGTGRLLPEEMTDQEGINQLPHQDQ